MTRVLSMVACLVAHRSAGRAPAMALRPFGRLPTRRTTRFLASTAPPPLGASLAEPPKRAMVAFHQDERGDWVAVLDCGHYQHVRHNPPMSERPWVVSEQGRASFLGYGLPCKKCRQGAPKDTNE